VEKTIQYFKPNQAVWLSFVEKVAFKLIVKNILSWGLVAHAYNPSYLGG
jgi:hypothetical protein